MKPRNTNNSRLNALKHGFGSNSITELDDQAKLRRLTRELMRELDPHGTLETFLVKRAAFAMIRIERSCVFEAQRIQAHLHPTRFAKSKFDQELAGLLSDCERELIDPGSPAAVETKVVDELCDTFSRYESAMENRLYRSLAQLETLQASRKRALKITRTVVK